MQQAKLSPELLRTFVAIVETGGFIRAASHLHKTQSTISQQMRRLEQEAGVGLFAAQGRSRVLTPSGEILLGYAKRLLALQDEAVLALQQTQLEAELRIGVSHSLSEGIFPSLLGRFVRTYPQVRLQVATDYSDRLIQQYDCGEYDLVLTLEREAQSGEILGQEDMVWIGAEQFTWPVGKPLPLATYSQPCLFCRSSVQALDRAGLAWQIVYTANSLSALLAAVRAGLAVSVRARHAVSSGIEILTPRLDLPALPQLQVVLRHRVNTEAASLLAQELQAVHLQAA